MTDIVERLRSVTDWLYDGVCADGEAIRFFSKAADEIERLRAELAAANAQLEEAREQIDVERYERDALRAQLAEAREALEECASDLEQELLGRYTMGTNKQIHPAMVGRFERDMQPVVAARAVLEKIKGGGDE